MLMLLLYSGALLPNDWPRLAEYLLLTWARKFACQNYLPLVKADCRSRAFVVAWLGGSSKEPSSQGGAFVLL